jgi:regulatory protein YycI of two-component signal transduction system YycFG
MIFEHYIIIFLVVNTLLVRYLALKKMVKSDKVIQLLEEKSILLEASINIYRSLEKLKKENEHICIHCGALTTQSDDECYRNPLNNKDENN